MVSSCAWTNAACQAYPKKWHIYAEDGATTCHRGVLRTGFNKLTVVILACHQAIYPPAPPCSSFTTLPPFSPLCRTLTAWIWNRGGAPVQVTLTPRRLVVTACHPSRHALHSTTATPVRHRNTSPRTAHFNKNGDSANESALYVKSTFDAVKRRGCGVSLLRHFSTTFILEMMTLKSY